MRNVLGSGAVLFVIGFLFVRYPASSVTAAYLLMFLVTLVGGFYQLFRRQVDPRHRLSAYAQMLELERRFGKRLSRLILILQIVLFALIWPLLLLQNLVLAGRGRLRTDRTSQTFSAVFVPAWISPSLATALLLGLLMLFPESATHWPLAAVLVLVMLAVYLNLLSATVVISLGERILSLPGNKTLAFLLVVVFNMISATLVRMWILLLSDQPPGSFLDNALAIWTQLDSRVLTGVHHASLNAVADGTVRIFDIRFPVELGLSSLLATLFSLSCATVLLKTIRAKREPKHYLQHALGYAAFDEFEKARDTLTPIFQPPRDVLSALSAIHVRLGAYGEAERCAKRLCDTTNVDFAAEEAALIGITAAMPAIMPEQKTFVGYVSHLRPGFSDPLFALAITFIVLQALRTPDDPVPERAVQEGFFEGLPLNRAALEIIIGHPERAIDPVLGAKDDSLLARLLKIVLGLSILILADLDGKADRDVLAAMVDTQIEQLDPITDRLETHWQGIVALNLLIEARKLYQPVFGHAGTRLPGYVKAVRARMCESELLGDQISAASSIQDAEIALIHQQLGGRLPMLTGTA